MNNQDFTVTYSIKIFFFFLLFLFSVFGKDDIVIISSQRESQHRFSLLKRNNNLGQKPQIQSDHDDGGNKDDWIFWRHLKHARSYSLWILMALKPHPLEKGLSYSLQTVFSWSSWSSSLLACKDWVPDIITIRRPENCKLERSDCANLLLCHRLFIVNEKKPFLTYIQNNLFALSQLGDQPLQYWNNLEMCGYSLLRNTQKFVKEKYINKFFFSSAVTLY